MSRSIGMWNYYLACYIIVTAISFTRGQAPADDQVPADDQAPADVQSLADDQAPADSQVPAGDSSGTSIADDDSFVPVTSTTTTTNNWGGEYMPINRGSHPGLAQDTSHLLASIWSNNTGEYAPATCEIPARSGVRSGICQDKIEELRSQLSFCKEAVQYRVCVPAHQPLWESWNATAKDKMLANLFQQFVQHRIRQEANVTPYQYVEHRFLANPDCIAAFKNVLCWYNFPKCSDMNLSLPLCSKSCKTFMEACKYANAEETCDPSYPGHHGLFGIGVHGPDQILAHDDVQCQSTAAYAASIPLEVTEVVWYTTPWGILLICIGVTILIYIVSIFNIPEGLRAYVKWQTTEILLIPYRIWLRLPTLRGRTVGVQFTAVCVILLALGLLRTFGPKFGLSILGGGMDRFDTKSFEAPEDKKFEPAQDRQFQIDVQKPIKGRQLRDLVASCSCTGASHRTAHPHLLFSTFAGILIMIASTSMYK